MVCISILLGRFLGSFQPSNINAFQYIPRNGIESWFSCWSKDGRFFIYSRGFGYISIANFQTASEKVANDKNILALFRNIDYEDDLAPDMSSVSNPSRAFVAEYLIRLIKHRNNPEYGAPPPSNNGPVFKSFAVGSPASPVLSLDTTLIQISNRLLFPTQTNVKQTAQKPAPTSMSQSEDPLGSIFALIRRASNPLSLKRGRPLELNREAPPASSDAQTSSAPLDGAPLLRTISSPEPESPPAAATSEPHTLINVLAVGLENGTVRLFNLNTPEVQSLATLQHKSLTSTSSAVRALLFSPSDPTLLATAGRDAYVKLWRWTDFIYLSGNHLCLH